MACFQGRLGRSLGGEGVDELFRGFGNESRRSSSLSVRRSIKNLKSLFGQSNVYLGVGSAHDVRATAYGVARY